MPSVLVVDDDADLRKPLVMFLEAHGFKVAEAKDGVEAVHLFRHVENVVGENPFDFVVSDYQMPRMNGVLLLMELRHLEPTQKMVLMSADPPKLPQEIADIPVMHKPFRLKELVELLTKL
jgi:CheY-like chemotaxis protein